MAKLMGCVVGRELREFPEEMVEAVASYLNTFSGELTKDFVEAMGRQHRTLQQNFTKLCFGWIKHLAKQGEFEYDLRNEASVKAAKAIIEKVGEDQLCLPYI